MPRSRIHPGEHLPKELGGGCAQSNYLDAPGGGLGGNCRALRKLRVVAGNARWSAILTTAKVLAATPDSPVLHKDSTGEPLPQKQVVGCVQSSYLQAREGARAAIVVKIVDVESLKKTEGRVLWTR